MVVIGGLEGDGGIYEEGKGERKEEVVWDR